MFTFAKTIPLDPGLITTEHIEAEWLFKNEVSLDVLRLDKIDPVISGNKWFKLKYYVEDALQHKKPYIATFGGPWSNHIIATAAASQQAGLKSIGIIRGEKTTELSYTLSEAIKYGMEMHFASREQYRRKEEIIQTLAKSNVYWVDEGGYGTLGAKGAAEILKSVELSNYSYIVAAVGTGTMLAGLIKACTKNQKVIGISSMKGNYALNQQIEKLLENEATEASFDIKHEYHFGGYGKHPEMLIQFINRIYHYHSLPLDIVYTGKTLFAIKDMAEKKLFTPGSKILMIHSGGLQGNKSLHAKVLAF